MRERVVEHGTIREGQHVVYWCTAQRRADHNHALAYAADVARAHDVPLVVLEPLRLDYPHASKRLHRFIVEGMVDNASAYEDAPVLYHPYVEGRVGAGKGLLAAYAKDACLIVADHFPHFFLPRMVEAAKGLGPLHVVDGNGLTPLASCGPFATAVAFRRHFQKNFRWDPPRVRLDGLPRLGHHPAMDAWEPPALDSHELAWLDALPLDGPDAVALRGGSVAGGQRLDDFVAHRDRYLERNQPDAHAESGLSPYLHFGHVGAYHAVEAVLRAEKWNPGKVSDAARGARQGWWGVSEAAEAWLDQICIWRDLGFIEMHHRPEASTFTDLPEWAQDTLNAHRGDPRPGYSFDQLEAAGTDDEVWNAAQRQLLREGNIHNYMRMLWGKKILRWAPDPETALEWMFTLNDRYALDGRDPNSVSGILWCLGRYDRGWPERDVLGKVRMMTSGSARKKLLLGSYLEQYAA